MRECQTHCPKELSLCREPEIRKIENFGKSMFLSIYTGIQLPRIRVYNPGFKHTSDGKSVLENESFWLEEREAPFTLFTLFVLESSVSTEVVIHESDSAMSISDSCAYSLSFTFSMESSPTALIILALVSTADKPLCKDQQKKVC